MRVHHLPNVEFGVNLFQLVCNVANLQPYNEKKKKKKMKTKDMQ